jgi:hypothetical protein
MYPGGRATNTSSSFKIRIISNAPSSPKNLKAIVVDGNVTLSWDAVSNIDFYRIYRSNMSGMGYHALGFTKNVTWIDTGLNNNTTYYYAVSSVKNQTESMLSKEVNVTLVNPGQPPIDNPQRMDYSLYFIIVVVIAIVLLVVLFYRKGDDKSVTPVKSKGDPMFRSIDKKDKTDGESASKSDKPKKKPEKSADKPKE